LEGYVNPILLTDSYKTTHWVQYPPKTSEVYSYLESRGGTFDEIIFTGLQYQLKKYLTGQRIVAGDISEASELLSAHFGTDRMFNKAGWEHILRYHEGRWPVLIKAAPEGTPIRIHNVLLTIENTCPECFWVTNYLETLIMQVWYPITVATISREIKRIITKYLKKTGDQGLIDFKLHDFGFRGVSSVESALIGGMAHLVNFKGTDTLAAVWGARKYYNEPCAGFSIPASEHSTITSWGQDGETNAFANMLAQYPTGYVACVSDSFNIYKAIKDKWGTALRDTVMKRDGTLVVRPDSGKPEQVVLECLRLLGEAFGYSINDKGYKVLNPHVRLIQGDGVNIGSIAEILHAMDKMDWSADNVAFGMGGALLQKLDRDTQKMAIKCSSVTVDGIMRDVFKDPITDQGKISMRGKLILVDRGGRLFTQPASLGVGDDLLIDVFKDGNMLVDHTFQSVRERATL
jgi:nicotinamide phosphoribosyltransferase